MENKFTIAKNTKRSPLKALPLHTAGQSIDDNGMVSNDFTGKIFLEYS